MTTVFIPSDPDILSFAPLPPSDPDYIDFSRPPQGQVLPKDKLAPLRLSEETGRFLLSHYGAGFALGFKGDPDFIHRCFNWAMNTGMISVNARLNWFYERETGRLGYVCVSSKDKVYRALVSQFRAEIVLDGEVEPVYVDSVDSAETDLQDSEEPNGELVYDDAAIQRLAEERAREFMDTRIVPDNFFLQQTTTMAHVYGMGRSKGRETSWGE